MTHIQLVVTEIITELERGGFFGPAPLELEIKLRLEQVLTGTLRTKTVRVCHTRDTRLNSDDHCHGGSGVTETPFEYVAWDPLDAWKACYPKEFVMIIHGRGDR